MEAQDTKRRLLEQARDLYLREGFAGLSMRRLAEGVGLSVAAAYRHFENKEELLSTVCTEGFQLFSAYLVRGLSGATPRERLLETGRQYMRFALEHPNYYQVMFLSDALSHGYRSMPQENRARAGASFLFLVDRVRECVGAGVLRQDDPTALAAIIWAQVHGLMSLRLLEHLSILNEEGFADFYERAVNSLLLGLAPSQTKK
jgi:AcrR family transcriptional regulator